MICREMFLLFFFFFGVINTSLAPVAGSQDMSVDREDTTRGSSIFARVLPGLEPAMACGRYSNELPCNSERGRMLLDPEKQAENGLTSNQPSLRRARRMN